MRGKVEIFQLGDRLFRWRLVYRGKVVAYSGKGYVKKDGAKQNLSTATYLLTDRAPVVDLTLKVRSKEL